MPDSAFSEALFNLAADGIVVHELISETAGGHFIRANPAICSLLGYTRAEMRDLTPLDIMAPEDRQVVDQDAETMAHAGVLRHEKTLVAKNGRRIPVEISTQLFPYRSQTLVMSIIRDITERKQAEEELLARHAELTEFNRLMVDRELRMIELKREINELCRQANLPPRYDVSEEGV